MHTLVVLLTKAEDREDAISNAESFLENYGEGDVWDWYSIGGRWNNYLAPKEKVEEFYKQAKEKFPVLAEGYYTINEIEKTEAKEVLQKLWENLGLQGKNTYYDSFGFSIDGESEPYNIMELSQCLNEVKDLAKNLEEEKEEYWNKMIEAKQEAKEGKYDMSGYYAGLYKNAQYGDFSFETNVYNIDEQVAEAIPEDISGYWAVVVDMHN